ncbi:MAG: antibiotic biosynthesis monooxygenase [Micrococcales bacterium]|nr:antibiotic biosynthesis monooxygenase [Micrococcales bacterium]
MDLTHVYVHVHEADVANFIRESIEDARLSKQEPGHIDFQLLQQSDDSTRFVMIEAYLDADAAAAHKRTQHYKTWHDAVEPMMVQPRRHVKFRELEDDR